MLLLKLALSETEGPLRQVNLANALGLSQAEVFKAIGRCAESGLLDLQSRRVNRHALLEFIEHGLKYVFPARLRLLPVGFPPRGQAQPSAGHVGGEAEKPVWPSADR